MLPLFKQLYASSGMFALLFSHGYLTGIQSILLASLKKPGSTIHLTLEEESWLPSITVLMIFPAQCICGILTHKFGRKYVLAGSLVPNLIAFILIYFAKNFTSLFIASLIAGLFGGGMAIGHLMIAEICSPKNRGTILNLKHAFNAIGIGIPHFLGNYYDYKDLVLFGILFALLGLITTFTSPESPAWLAGQGRFEDCTEAFLWLRGNDNEGELKQLIESQRRDLMNKKLNRNDNINPLMQFFKSISDKSFLRALSINIVGLMLVEMTGRPVFTVYAIDIINSITGHSVNPHFYALGMDVADIFAAILSCVLIRKLTRRTLLFGTGTLGVILLFTFCLLVYLQTKEIMPEGYSWVSLVVIGMYFIDTSSGVVNVMFTIIGEVFPLQYRGLGIATSSCVFGILMFTGMKLTPSLIRALGVHGTFLVNSIVMSFCLLFLHYTVPETTDKTLQDIEDEIRGNIDAEKVLAGEKEKMLSMS